MAEALARALPYPFTYHGLELNPDAVAAAQQRWRGEGARAAASAGSDVRFEQADLLARAPDEGWADVALCLEVLEHLQQPERAVARLHDWTSAFAIVSVPHEPYFRLGSLLRGKYVRTLGNHPEHCQHFDARSLAALMKTAFATVQVESRFPWLIAVARRAPPWGTRGPPG